MSSFSGTERGLLSDAVLAAFPENLGLRQWLDRKLNSERTKDDDNVFHSVNFNQNPNDVAFALVQWLESRGRTIEFLAKIALDYPNRAVFSALRESLACSENESEAQLRFRGFLKILADQPLNEVVIRFIQQIPGCPDPLPEPLRLTVDRERVVVAELSPTSENDFDRHAGEVTKTIRSKLDAIKDAKVLDENDQEVWLLTLVSQELGAGDSSSGKELSEYLATFLADRRDIEHVGLLVSRVFDLLCKRRKKAEAQIIGNVVDLMLPLCIPRDILSEAWVQLKDHGAVLIRSSVARKAGAEMLVAGLFKKSTRWGTSSPEPTGEQLVGFEDVPIGDPDQNVESALHDLYVATFYPADKRTATSLNMRLTAALMRADLSGHYRFRRLGPQRPCYCAVELAACEADRENQRQLISNLAIPDLLFIELKPDSGTRELESFVIHCLNTRLGSLAKGFAE